MRESAGDAISGPGDVCADGCLNILSFHCLCSGDGFRVKCSYYDLANNRSDVSLSNHFPDGDIS